MRDEKFMQVASMAINGWKNYLVLWSEYEPDKQLPKYGCQQIVY
jgi:hypothetical protein